MSPSLFKSERQQLWFEFMFLVVSFFGACTALLLIYMSDKIPVSTKMYLYSYIGGFMGGWTFVAKWFARAVGKGKGNIKWDPNKFYWRILMPLISSITSFAVYTLTVSKVFPLISIDQASGVAAFGFSFVAGCFSDAVYKKLGAWVDKSWWRNDETENELSNKVSGNKSVALVEGKTKETA